MLFAIIQDRLQQLFKQYTDIPQEQWEKFQSITYRKCYPKHAYYVQTGQQKDEVGICVKGMFRFFYTTADGKEFNKSFCGVYELVSSYSSLLQNKPSALSIQSLAESEVVAFSYSGFLKLYEQHRCWETIGRKIAEHLFVKKELREQEFLLLSAEERYTNFLDKYGEEAEQIPQYHVASYLGITPIALSRIRRRMRGT